MELFIYKHLSPLKLHDPKDQGNIMHRNIGKFTGLYDEISQEGKGKYSPCIGY